jgi:hypothetical protein
MLLAKIIYTNTNFIDNEWVLLGIAGCVVGALGYKIISTYLRSKYLDKGTQTDASENLTDRPNQITQENLALLDSLSPVSSSSSIQTLSPVSSSSSLETLSPRTYTSSIQTLSPISSSSTIETLSPISSSSTIISDTSEIGVQTTTKNINTITTDLPINKEVVPNVDIVGRVVDTSNAEYIADKVEQLNALDPFSATPWTAEKVKTIIDNLEIINNLF